MPGATAGVAALRFALLTMTLVAAGSSCIVIHILLILAFESGGFSTREGGVPCEHFF